MTEFALVAPLFFLLIFGVIQMGILLGGQIGLTNAVREVARYASTVGANSQTNLTITTYANPVLQRSIPAYNSSAASTVTYCYYPNPITATNPTATYSWKVIITTQYGHTLFVPLVGALIDRIDGTADNRLTVTAREEMKVETQPLKTIPAGTACGANP
ncbi:MAG: pilus assembly protein [Chloroflexi bacterium]|nr:pilus assembly protein [Chloroflexota bacterium]